MQSQFIIVGLVFAFLSLPVTPAEPVAYPPFGIGAELEKKGSDIVIKQLIPDGSAEKAGIPVGTRLVSVDGKPVTGMSIKDIVNLIRGAAGTVVSLVVTVNPGVNRTYSLVRTEIKMVTVDTVAGTYVPVDDPGATVVVERLDGNRFSVSSVKQHWSGIGLSSLLTPPDVYCIKGVYVMDDHPDVIESFRRMGVFFRIEFSFNNRLKLLTRDDFEHDVSHDVLQERRGPLSTVITHILQKQ